MDYTRSGRKVKRSSKFRDMEYNDIEGNTASGNDLDYNQFEDERSSEDDDSDNYDGNVDDDYYGAPRQSSRLNNKSMIMTEGLTWKDGKLVPSNETPMIMPTLRTKVRQKVVKESPASLFYSSAIESLKKPNLTYNTISNNNNNKVDNEVKNVNEPQIDLLNDERFNINLVTKNQSLIPKYDKSNDKINEIVGLHLEMEDLQRYSRLTGYILFTIISKKKTENNITLADNSGQSHRKIQDNWASMPERTKRDWEIKAKQVKKLVDTKRRNDVIEDGNKTEKRHLALKKAEENIKKSKITNHSLADLAYYLKAVSEGMSKLSVKLANEEVTVGIQGVESVMLDYLLCSLVSLMGIFEESEGLDSRSCTTDSLNRLAFIIPGLF